MVYRGMREWIDRLERENELKRVKTPVDWDLEIGGIVRMICDIGGPAVLFENIKDYQDTPCTKLFAGATQGDSVQRTDQILAGALEEAN